ncbi:MAG: hypothetical protein JNM28_07845 [Armatimonadetes bacterium]|nr:hypothetical protein [Armatimonadota bacterium]
MASVLYSNFGGQIVQEDRNGQVRTYVHDDVGNTMFLLDASGVTDSYEYTPYGQLSSHVGSSVTPFTFAGAVGYYATGLAFFASYVRMRWLSALSGNWGAVDPLWPGQKPYQYVEGRVTNAVDPSGTAPSAKQHGKCKITTCVRHGFGGNIIATHALFCIQTANPNKSCDSDIYPDHVYATVNNNRGCDDWACAMKADPGTTCSSEQLDCSVASMACNCIGDWASHIREPNYFAGGTCYGHGRTIIRCACEKLRVASIAMWLDADCRIFTPIIA